jgi:hypothetical protein
MEHYKKVARWYEHVLPSPETDAARAAYERQLSQAARVVEEFMAAADEKVRASLAPGATLPEKLETLYPAEAKTELKKLRDALTALEKNPPELPAAMGSTEDRVADEAIRIRGNPLKLGDVVPRHVPQAIRGPAPPRFTMAESGRRELALWLVDPAHPLTARVLVNRVWRWHFGAGLVRSPDNFGLLGERPTHPELLDWLARNTIDEGWSLKGLHRALVTSSTYRQSSVPRPPTASADPANLLWGRTHVRRLEAEAVRDALLAVSGQLDLAIGGSLLAVKNRGYFFDHTSKDLTDYNSRRRSLYLPVVRNHVYEVFQLLDFPDPALPSGDRATTTIAPQALLMLNSDLVLGAAADVAERLLTAADSDRQRIAMMYWLAYGRPARESEQSACEAFLAAAERELAVAASNAPEGRRDAWAALCQTIFAANEFVYVP